MELEPIDVKLADPRPLECLSGSLIPPFLSKTFDLVDEPSLDSIISWSCNGRSFVVKDPIEFSKTLLPRNFKHNNLSSFIRQLNTYVGFSWLETGIVILGFRKIDPDRLEFANEEFRQGSRHLLKNIRRRKSSQSPKQGGSYLEPSFVEAGRSDVEGKVKKLIEEKNLLSQDVVELQQQHDGTVRYMELLNQKIILAEQRQKQTISFVANLFKNPTFLPSVEQIKDKEDVGSSRTKRRSVNLQIVKYEPNIPNVPSISAATDLNKILPEELHDHIPKKHGTEAGTSVENTRLEPENAEMQEPSIEAKFTGEQRFLNNEEVGQGEVSNAANNHLMQQEFTHEPFMSFQNFQGIFSPGIESEIKPENLWSNDFDTILDTPNFYNDSWVDNSHYDEQGLGVTDELSSIWDFDSPQHLGCSGAEKCPSSELALNDQDSQEVQEIDDTVMI